MSRLSELRKSGTIEEHLQKLIVHSATEKERCYQSDRHRNRLLSWIAGRGTEYIMLGSLGPDLAIVLKTPHREIKRQEKTVLGIHLCANIS